METLGCSCHTTGAPRWLTHHLYRCTTGSLKTKPQQAAGGGLFQRPWTQSPAAGRSLLRSRRAEQTQQHAQLCAGEGPSRPQAQRRRRKRRAGHEAAAKHRSRARERWHAPAALPARGKRRQIPLLFMPIVSFIPRLRNAWLRKRSR